MVDQNIPYVAAPLGRPAGHVFAAPEELGFEMWPDRPSRAEFDGVSAAARVARDRFGDESD